MKILQFCVIPNRLGGYKYENYVAGIFLEGSKKVTKERVNRNLLQQEQTQAAAVLLQYTVACRLWTWTTDASWTGRLNTKWHEIESFRIRLRKLKANSKYDHQIDKKLSKEL